MNTKDIVNGYAKISKVMSEQREYLIELDQRNGDGDLGISMDNGFRAAYEAIAASDETDLGKLLLLASKTFNNEAPSSLGTILSIGMMGMAKSLKGKTDCTVAELGDAMNQGLLSIMDKAGSKPGEKTILDALVPAVDTMKQNSEASDVFMKAFEAAENGAMSTKNMRSVHGRAAYYGDQSIGLVDGGAIAATFIFKALAE